MPKWMKKRSILHFSAEEEKDLEKVSGMASVHPEKGKAVRAILTDATANA